MAAVSHAGRTDPVSRASTLRLLRLLATAGVAMGALVVVSSAYLRLAQAGLSCGDWPACYGRVTRHAAEAVPTAQIAARIVHRVAAGSMGLALLALVFIARGSPVRRRLQTGIAIGGLVVAAGLATIGAVMSEAASPVPVPFVTVANLAGGFALVALLWWLRLCAASPSPLPSPATVWPKAFAGLALAAMIVQVVIGALVSARFAGLACPGFPACGAALPDHAWSASLDFSAPLAVDANGAIARPPLLAALHWTHRIWAHVVLALVALLTFVLVRRNDTRGLGCVVAALMILQLGLGAGAVLNGLPLPLVLAHNGVALLLLLALITATWHLHGAAAGQPSVPARRDGPSAVRSP